MSASDLISGVQGLGLRFALVGFLPLAVLALFVLALLAAGAPEEAPRLERILEEARELDGWDGGLLVLSLLVATLLLQPFEVALVRVLEGYWGEGRVGTLLAGPGRWIQGLRLDRLRKRLAPARTPAAAIAQASAELARRRLFPPDRSELLPTRLGNALRAAERRSGEPYGIDAVAVWPWLYPLLPDPLRGMVDDRRNQLDLAARFTVVFLAAAAISLWLLKSHGAWLAVPAGCLALAWQSYRAAVTAAIAYGEGVRTAIDLHRFDLLAALHLPLPDTPAEERALNRQLTAFLLQQRPIERPYVHGGAAGEPEPELERSE